MIAFQKAKEAKRGPFYSKHQLENNCKFHNRQGRNDLVKAQFLVLGKHISKSTEKEFPDSPVLRTTNFHCRAQVQSFIRELRSHKPHGEAKKEKRAQKGARNHLKAIDFLKKTYLYVEFF